MFLLKKFSDFFCCWNFWSLTAIQATDLNQIQCILTGIKSSLFSNKNFGDQMSGCQVMTKTVHQESSGPRWIAALTGVHEFLWQIQTIKEKATLFFSSVNLLLLNICIQSWRNIMNLTDCVICDHSINRLLCLFSEIHELIFFIISNLGVPMKNLLAAVVAEN